MTNTLQFILVKDATRARYLRRKLAEKKVQLGVVVGTFSSLVKHTQENYLIPNLNTEWYAGFQNLLAEQEGFWSKSYQIAPDETASIIKRELVNLITASSVTDKTVINNIDSLERRLERHLNDLFALYSSLNEKLDDGHEVLREAILTSSDYSIQHIQVYTDFTVVNLSVWQQALVDKLNTDSQGSKQFEFLELLQRGSDEVTTAVSTGLGALQSHIYSPIDKIYNLDETLQFVGLRDYQEEADVAAGMVQEILQNNHELSEKDIGILMPVQVEYSFVIKDAFDRAGLSLSGLGTDTWIKNLGRDVVFHFLYCRQTPAPAMALSVCLSSALMPWSHEEGAVLSQSIMNGDYRLRALPGASTEARAMLQCIAGSDDSPSTLIEALKSFVALLNDHGVYSDHVSNAQISVDLLCDILEGAVDIPWKTLRRIVSPKNIRSLEDISFNQQGVTVWREGQCPWRSVRHLLVLGFSEAHYPESVGSSLVFSHDDLKQIQNKCNLNMITSDDILKHRRLLFKDQLSQVSESATFLIPRCDTAGERISPSDSLVFIEQIFGSSSSMILEIDVTSDREQVRFLAQTKETTPTEPRSIESDDLQFDSNLLHLRQDKDGNPKPESPSGLEKLMVSPLAWMLNRLNVQAQEWAPEEPDVLIQGTLAHYVFEMLFSPGNPLPDPTTIPDRASKILDDGILKYAPFLRASQWQVERANLSSGIVKAALEWRQTLDSLGAQVIGSEQWLKGEFSDISVIGQADSIIKLPNDQILVVDYKRSSSKSRKPRMEKAYDSQAYLYITMLKSGAAIDIETIDIQECMAKNEPGIVYYMLNDQSALTDYANKKTTGIPGWDYISDDVSSYAIELIRSRLKEIKAGEIKLNRSTDNDFFETEAGIKPYALDDTPLISLFTCEDVETAE